MFETNVMRKRFLNHKLTAQIRVSAVVIKFIIVL